MSEKYKLSKCDCRYGAPMGRPSVWPGRGPGDSWPPQAAAQSWPPLRLRRLALDSGGYDGGGAYWGCGRPLFVAYGDGVEIFIRDAETRPGAGIRTVAAAAAHLRRVLPGVRLARVRGKP